MGSYTVQQGDCLVSIAAQFGYKSWQDVWNAPGNSGLRTNRKNPNVLYPGDVVDLPPKKPPTFQVPTGVAHRFVLTRPPSKLRLRLLDGAAAMSREPYVLSGDGMADQQGQTNGDGTLETQIPATLTSATLKLTDRGLTLTLKGRPSRSREPGLRRSGPPQALGGYGGAVDGSASDSYLDALFSLRAAAGLGTDGELDADAASALERWFGC